MSQNVNFMSQQMQATDNKQGFIGALAQTGMTALPGAVIGGAAGGVLSLLPPTKGAVKKQIGDVFVAAGEDSIKSEGTKKLIESLGSGANGIIENLKQAFNNFKTGKANIVGSECKEIPKELVDKVAELEMEYNNKASELFDGFYKEAIKNNDFLKQAKKAAKKASRSSLIKNGVLLGVISILFLSLIQSKKNPQENKE